jgi:hypothetical protein
MLVVVSFTESGLAFHGPEDHVSELDFSFFARVFQFGILLNLHNNLVLQHLDLLFPALHLVKFLRGLCCGFFLSEPLALSCPEVNFLQNCILCKVL